MSSAPRPPLLLPLHLLLLLPLITESARVLQPLTDPKPSDTDVLAIFRSSADAHGILAGNWSSSDACLGHWRGVGCSDGRITSLSLPSLDLRGVLDPLSHLDELRVLDLHNNRLNGTLLPLISSIPNLKLLYLSGNDISGEIPPAIGRLTRLLRVDLSDNNFDGAIPGEAFSNLNHLLTLRLQSNMLSGRLPDFGTALPLLVEFNVSNNQLAGRVPEGVRAKFGLEAVAGNAGFCSPTPPLPLCSFIPHDPPPSISSSPSSQVVVPSNPRTVPRSPAATTNSSGREEKRVREGLSTGTIIGIAVGNAAFLLLLLILFLTCCCCCAGYSGEKDGKVDPECEQGENYKRSSSTSYTNDNDEKRSNGKRKKTGGSSGESDDAGAVETRSQLVFFVQTEGEEDKLNNSGDSGRRIRKKNGNGREKNSGRRFELEELLQASAEMLGKGNIGTVYRAALEDGEMLAVKRLKDANPCARKDFHQYMDLIGRLSLPNIIRLRAYYYAKQEKLLIYDYLPNGTLFSLIHGNRGTGRVPLDWTTRLCLVLGAARGLDRIHREYSSSKIPHGNIKSSNILLDKNGMACISDFGLALLLSPAQATARLGGYAAPEQAATRKLSQEADVYAFGVLLLEVLTGKAPNQWHCTASPGGEITTGGPSLSLPEWVRSVVREEWTAEVFDAELMRYKNIQEEMVAMLHVGLACVALEAEARPAMSEVVRMIEEIRVEQSPLADDDDDDDDDELNESRSVSVSPSLPTTATEDGRISYALTE